MLIFHTSTLGIQNLISTMSSEEYSDPPGAASKHGVELTKQKSVSSLRAHFESLSESNKGICSTQYIFIDQ